MSEENVELVRASIEVYNDGNIDEVLNFMAEDVEIEPDASFPEVTPFIGRDEYGRFLEEIAKAWQGGAGAPLEEIVSVGELVVARMEWGGIGRETGIEMRSNLSAVNTVRDGQIVKIQFFLNHSQALEAAGLSE